MLRAAIFDAERIEQSQTTLSGEAVPVTARRDKETGRWHLMADGNEIWPVPNGS